MLKIAISLVAIVLAFLQASDDQYVGGAARFKRASGYSHFDAASAEIAEKKRVKFRLGAGVSHKIAKLGRKTFGNQAAALLLTMPDVGVKAKHLKRKDKAIEVETIEFTDEARKPPFLEETAYNPIGDNVSTQDD